MTAPTGLPLAGPAFPFRVVGGRVARSAHDEKVADDVRHLLATRLGERLLRRSYGGGVHQRLQEPHDSTLRTLVRHEVEQALRDHLPQLRLSGPVRVTSTVDELRVVLDYRLAPDEVVRRLEAAVPRAGAP